MVSAFCTNVNSQDLSNRLALSAQILVGNIFCNKGQNMLNPKNLMTLKIPLYVNMCESYVNLLVNVCMKYLIDQVNIIRKTA